MQTENVKYSRVSEFDMKTRGLKVLCGSVYTLLLFAQEDWAALTKV